MRLRSITLQFALALAAAALLPLVCFGAWSLTVLNRAARTAAATGNVRMAEVEAAQVGQDGLEAIARVNALATALSAASDRDEQRLLLRSASTDAGPFRQIAVVDAAGRTVVASTDEPTRRSTPPTVDSSSTSSSHPCSSTRSARPGRAWPARSATPPPQKRWSWRSWGSST